jgi:hypothetical protein
MKNFKSREEFLKAKKLDESLNNEISWGDSYLGRLINSTLRIGEIYVKKVGLSGLAKQLKNELESLVAITRMNDDDIELIYHQMEAEFLNVQKSILSNNNLTEKQKVELLIGNAKNVKGNVTESFEDTLDIYIQDLENYLQTLP